jgi:hypothetical protein
MEPQYGTGLAKECSWVDLIQNSVEQMTGHDRHAAIIAPRSREYRHSYGTIPDNVYSF